MRIKSILPMLMMTAATMIFSINAAEAAEVNVQVNGYLPAPPGVNVQVDAGRPYYMQHDRRVYIERERPGRHGRYKHYAKHQENHGNKGHGKHEEHGNKGHDKHEEHGH